VSHSSLPKPFRISAFGILPCLLVLTLHPSAFSGTWCFTWDPPVCTNQIVAYKLYSGPCPRGYTNSITVLTNRAAIPVYPGAPVYFAVTAIDTAGLESDFSNELLLWNDIGKSNLVVTVSTTGTNLLWSAAPRGPWTATNRTAINLTNPISPRFWRARGPATNRVTITRTRF